MSIYTEGSPVESTSGRTRKKKNTLSIASLAAPVLCLGMVLSAFGLSSAASATAKAVSSSKATAIATAKSKYKQFIKVQPQISIPTLPAKPPTGKTIGIMTCPLPACATSANSETAAANLLGWKVTSVPITSLTPQGYIGAITELVQLHPDFASIIPLVPDTFIATQIAALQKAGTKIVEASGSSIPASAGPVEGVVIGTPQTGQSGALMGDAVVANSKGPAQTVIVWDPKACQ